jgi:hypothetical protein
MTPRTDSRRHGCRRAHWPLAAALAAMLLAAPLTGCATFSGTVPGCGDPLRLAIIAQSVPGAAYVPCIRELPQGWSTSGFDPARGRTTFLLNSDRSPGQPVRVQLAATCRIGRASPSSPRAPGVLTDTRLTSISPRFAGSLYDVFPGGCVSYSFDFTAGQHIALMEQFEGAVGLYPRQQLRLVLQRKLGVELNP